MAHNPFEQAKTFFRQYAEPLKLDERFPGKGLLTRMVEPDRSIEFRLSLQRDNGTIESFRAYRIQFNDDRGPYKGGLRFHPVVNMEEMKAMGLWMNLKTSLVDIPFGGAKGGISVDYPSLSLAEKERLTKRFAMTLVDDIGPDKDIPAPDVNTGEREMAWIIDSWRMIHGRYDRGVVTGKPISLGGSQGRRAATGQGVVMILEEAAKDLNLELAKSSAAVQGFGNVGAAAARHLFRLGVRVCAVSDVYSAICNPEGLDIDALEAHYAATGRLDHFPKAQSMERDQLLEADVDILVPAALENAITVDNADRIRAHIVAEGANGPTTPEADAILGRKAITVLPDILCNAGGVTVSYFEWVQNRQEFYWSEAKVVEELRTVLANAYRAVAGIVAMSGCTHREAAYRVAIERLAVSMVNRGVQ